MINIIKAEFQKSRSTSINKFIIITPLLTILLSFMLAGGINGSYNWWYVMFLPGMLAIVSSGVIGREEKLSYKGLFLYPYDKGAMWLGKIIYLVILLVISSLIFMVGIIGIGFVSESRILLRTNILATIILIVTSIFQIPMSLFLTVKFNMFVATFCNIAMTALGVISFSTRYFYMCYPYGIPSALMAPILHILPNGLPVPTDSSLLNGNIFLDIVINIFTFFILTILTTIWFRNKEVS